MTVKRGGHKAGSLLVAKGRYRPVEHRNGPKLSRLDQELLWGAAVNGFSLVSIGDPNDLVTHFRQNVPSISVGLVVTSADTMQSLLETS